MQSTNSIPGGYKNLNNSYLARMNCFKTVSNSILDKYLIDIFSLITGMILVSDIPDKRNER